MGSYRGRIEIIADILQVAQSFAKKTQIMYQANLSYAVLQRYLSELIEASLISYENDKQCYCLTEKGREFLVIYKDYSRANKHIEKRLKAARSKKKALDNLWVTDDCSS